VRIEINIQEIHQATNIMVICNECYSISVTQYCENLRHTLQSLLLINVLYREVTAELT